MAKPLDEAWVRSKLADKIGDDDRILLEERTLPDGAQVRIEVAVQDFVRMFGSVDTDGTAAAVRDRLKGENEVPVNANGEPDPDGAEVADQGYAAYFEEWHAEGRFN